MPSDKKSKRSPKSGSSLIKASKAKKGSSSSSKSSSKEHKKAKRSSGRKLSPYNAFLAINIDAIKKWIEKNDGTKVTTKNNEQKVIDAKAKGTLMIAASYLFINPSKRGSGFKDVTKGNLESVIEEIEKKKKSK